MTSMSFGFRAAYAEKAAAPEVRARLWVLADRANAHAARMLDTTRPWRSIEELSGQQRETGSITHIEAILTKRGT